jgi:hypothetical protein
LLVSAVIADAGNFQVTAIAKISAAAGGTRIVLTAMPPNTDALTILPSRNAGTDFVDDARYLVSWNTRVLNSRPRAFFCENVTAADATGLYLDPHVSRARLRHLSVNDLEICSRFRNLRRLHWTPPHRIFDSQRLRKVRKHQKNVGLSRTNVGCVNIEQAALIAGSWADYS